VARLLTAREAADLLRVPKASLYALVRSGRLPAVRLSERRLRFDPQQVLDALRAAPAAAPAEEVVR
jgi:excisionase family DNA binding protein